MSSLRMTTTALVVALAACSGPQVRSLATGGAPAAYELRGQDPEQLRAQAARLCAQGYHVLRQSQDTRQAEPLDNAAAPWLQQAGDWISGTPGNEAQATVQCNG